MADAPSPDQKEMDIHREMTEVVAALVCFADHMLESGTAAEYATQLLKRMNQDTEDRKIAWQEKKDETRKRCDSSPCQHLVSAHAHARPDVGGSSCTWYVGI